MSKYLIISILGLSLCFLSCSKETDEASNKSEAIVTPDNTVDENSENVRYYIKYEVSWSTDPYVRDKRILYQTDKGIVEENFKEKVLTWEGTYGPVKNDFTAEINCDGECKDIHLRIYASRDKEPFVIKADTRTMSASYKIDF